MFYIKSSFSLYKEENLILFHVSDNEEMKVASLLMHLCVVLFFCAFKKITLK